ncbi:MAG: outer membrane beta-barrel protein [Pseudomonadales bacterium]
MNAQHPGILLLAGCALFTAANTQALDFGATVHYTSEYTTNTLRTESDEIDEWIQEPGVDLTVAHDTASLELDGAYGYSRRFYDKDYWSDYNSTTGSGNAVWHALPERLDFHLRNSRTESTQQALDTPLPDNRQVVSTTEAGSTLMLQPRQGDDLQFEYQYVDISPSSTSTGSTRNNGTGRYILGLSPNRFLQLETTYSDIKYDGVAFTNAEYWLATLGYRQTGNQLDVDVNYGHNWYKRSGQADTDDPSYDLALTWRASANSTFTLDGSHRITDQSSSLTDDAGSTGAVSENTATNAAFKESSADMGLTQIFGRTTLTLGGFWRKEQYAEGVQLSNETTGGRIGLSRDLTRNTVLNLNGEYANRKFSDQGDNQDETRLSVNLLHELGRALDLSWGVRYEDRQADISTSYDEWIGYVTISYQVLGAGNR